MTSAKRILFALIAVAAVLLGTAVPAAAHAALLKTDPGEGSVAKTAPASVLLTFSEAVLLSDDSLRVLDPQGKDVARGTAHHANGAQNTATVNLRPGLGDGTYTVAWKAVSADTHPVSGAWTFSIDKPSKAAAAVPRRQPGGGTAGTLYALGRYLGYGGFAVLVGACVFLTVCYPRGARLRVMRTVAVSGWGVLVGSTVALLLLRGPYVNGSSLGGIADLGQTQAAIQTKEGAALLSRLLLLAAAAIFLSVLFGPFSRRDGPQTRRGLVFGLGICGALIAAGIAATWAAAEHASVGLQPGLAMPVDVLHLLAMAVWLGGLVTLATALYSTTGIERAALRRFSRLAFTCVCVLVATGLYQTWRQVGSWHALHATRYGQLLMVKIGLVVIMVGAAGLSRRWTARLADGFGTVAKAPKSKHHHSVPATARTSSEPKLATQLARQQAAVAAQGAKQQRDAGPAHVGMRRSVLAEAAIAAVVLAVTTVLSNTESGRSAEQAAAVGNPPGGTAVTSTGPVTLALPYDTGGPNGMGIASVHLDPATTGTNGMHLTTTNPSGNPVDVPEVDLALTLPAKRLGPIRVQLEHIGLGAWDATSLQLPMPGKWRLDITVRTDAINETTLTKTITIASPR